MIIDISEHNGIINFEKIKDKVDGVIIRASFGQEKTDKMFQRNVNECIRLEIPFSFYLYSYALNEEYGFKEITHFLNVINDYKELISFPVVFDMEDGDKYKEKNGMPSNETLQNLCFNFCDTLSKCGIMPMIYASSNWFSTKLKCDKLEKYAKWVAWWGTDEKNIDKTKYKMWQYSSSVHLDGIDGRIDVSKSFVDFPDFFKKIHNLQKINFIKIKTGLEEITMQYFTLYKFGTDLILKIYKRLQKKLLPFEEFKEDLTTNEKLQIVMKEFELELVTAQYLYSYVYHKELIDKLYKSIFDKKIKE